MAFHENRRAFLKMIGALPLFTVERARAATGRNWKNNLYTRIGVRPLINGRGTWTYLSGSLELPEVRAAKHEASLMFVDMYELQQGVGKRLAELSGAEFGMVTAGAAAAMAAATAACIAGRDPRNVWQLPDTTGLKHEVVMFGGRSAFDNAIRLAGGKLVLARTHEELEAAINERTAMVYTTADGERLERALAITKRRGVPLLLDQAAGIPPIENLSLYARMGCDLYTFSGGKGLAGPQCSGLLLGRRDLVEAALANYNPWEGAVCRPMKVGKEEIMGCLAAVEAWKKKDLAAMDREWSSRVKRIAKMAETVAGVTTEIQVPKGGNRYPTLTVSWDVEAWKFSVQDCARALREGEPRIEVLTNDNPSLVPAVTEGHPKPPERSNRLRIVLSTLQPGEDLIIGRRLREILGRARRG